MSADIDTNAFCCHVIADGVTIGYFQKFSFPTINSFSFECPLGGERLFVDGLLKANGLLPYGQWTVVIFNSALRELRRYAWRHARVTLIRFPAVDNQFPKYIRFNVDLAFSLDVPHSRQSVNAAARPMRDLMQTCFIRLKIDGLEQSEWSVQKIDGFDVCASGQTYKTVVFYATPEALADPFRNWLANGNASRSGLLEILSPALKSLIGVQFTGLRVRTVTPALSSYSPGPAKMEFSYSDLRF